MHRNINATISSRILLAWFMLSITIGGAVYYHERLKIDDYIRDLALSESKVFNNEVADLISDEMNDSTRVLLLELAKSLIDDHFSVVEIYDLNKSHLVVVARPGRKDIELEAEKRKHQFPRDESIYYENFNVGDELYSMVLVPLETSDGKLAGYFDGVYHVEKAMLERIHSQVYRTIILVLTVVLVSSITLYPLILSLNREILKYSRDLLEANIQLMESLGSAIATRDTATNSHNYRVTIYAVSLAEALDLPAIQIHGLMAGSFLHDIGKIGISDSILRKPASLSDEERTIMRQHVLLGLKIVDKAKWMDAARDVIEFHHERYDGRGYSRGLKGDEIPLTARIFAVVDVFDALTSSRPYKSAFSLETALQMLEDERGRHFDPHILDGFKSVAQQLYETVSQAGDDILEEKLNRLEARYFLKT